MNKSERGSILPLFGLIGAVAVGSMIVLTYAAVAIIHASRAQTAADAAALAGSTKGRAMATQVAAANHAELTSFVVVGTDTIVVAKSGDTTRTARARRRGPAYALVNAG